MTENDRKLANARRALEQGPFSHGECQVFATDDRLDGAAVFATDGQPFAFFAEDNFVDGKEGALGAAEFVCDLLNVGRKTGVGS